MLGMAGSAAALAARCRNLRRGNFMVMPPEPEHQLYPMPTTMSAFGTKRTSQHAQPISAFGGKADMLLGLSDVRFWWNGAKMPASIATTNPNDGEFEWKSQS